MGTILEVRCVFFASAQPVDIQWCAFQRFLDRSRFYLAVEFRRLSIFPLCSDPWEIDEPQDEIEHQRNSRVPCCPGDPSLLPAFNQTTN